MSKAGVQFKIMPESLDVNLEDVEIEIEKVIESFDSGVFNNCKKEPIAFGLNALIVTFAISEEQEVEEVEAKIKDIEGISSVEMIDYRRAVG